MTDTLPSQLREYRRSECVTFRKTSEPFGGLSNMAPGFPLLVNRVSIRTSEALYQACRFPHHPELQGLVIGQRSPMAAKMVTKPHRAHTRADWDVIRIHVMRWALRVKLAQNWDRFSELLLSTGNLPIVEDSHKDVFWGAKPVDAERLVGQNILGRLLMELRRDVDSASGDSLRLVYPLRIPDFFLMGRPITVVPGEVAQERDTKNQVLEQAALL
jgi:ribA/ribD-fused uncharacterized protein